MNFKYLSIKRFDFSSSDSTRNLSIYCFFYAFIFRDNNITRTISTKVSTIISKWNNRAGCLKITHPLFEGNNIMTKKA